MLKPKKGEGKQAFMKRAVDVLIKEGKKEAEAMAEAARLWNEANLSSDDAGEFRLSAASFSLTETSGDTAGDAAGDAGGDGQKKPRRFSILANTGGINDLGYYRFIINLKGVEYQEKFPCFYEHDRRQILGFHDSVKITKDGFFCFGQFADTPIAEEVLRIAEGGYPWQSSVGVWPIETRFLSRGETATINGRKVEGPLDIWERSKIRENSICSLGVDEDTAAITMSRVNHNTEGTMKYSAELKLALGLAADATDDEVRAKLAELNIGKVEDLTEAKVFAHLLAQKPATVPADPQPAPAPAVLAPPATVQPVEVSAAVQKELAAERDRTNGIMSLSVKLGLSKEWAQATIAAQTTLADARQLAIDEATKGNGAFGSSRLTEGEHDSDKFRKLASAGIALRFGLGDPAKLDAGASQFRNMGLYDLALHCLHRAGINTAGMSRDQVARKILSREMVLAASTSDFKNIMMDVANKRMLESYGIVEETWRSFCSVATATDFKDMYGVALDGAPEMLAVPESGEYKSAFLSDSKESYRIAKYGRVIPLSWEAIVNDDMRFFMKIPAMFGAAAARLVLDLVYAMLASNPVMGDGKALFHTDRGNIATGSDLGRVTMGTLKAMRKAMANRRDASGQRVKVSPSTLIISIDQATDVDVLLTSAADPEGAHSGVNNPFRNAYTPVSDPHVDDISDNAWYAFAAPGQYEGIEVAFLNGQQTPELSEDESFNSDSMAYKARICCGVGAMGTLGAYFNPGQ